MTLRETRIDVPPERQFIGFDAYRNAIDCLRPGDVAMLTGYAGWRPLQLEYAVKKGVNVFMGKSFATDPPQMRRLIKAGKEAEKKNLKIAAGLMCRHSVNRQELIKRIRDGKIITWDEAMASNFQFCPNIDTMDYDTPPPIQPDEKGRYPVPIPGVWSEI